MAGDRERILAAGCVGYIEKPINPETFVADVEQCLQTSKAKRMRRRSLMSKILIVDDEPKNLYLLQRTALRQRL